MKQELICDGANWALAQGGECDKSQVQCGKVSGLVFRNLIEVISHS
jgi:hypothetical protein